MPFQVVNLWNCDWNPQCKKDLSLAGRIVGDYPKSLVRRSKEVDVGVRWVGGQRGII